MSNLATKYRPTSFANVMAQGYVKDILMHQVATKQFRHAYLFTGGAGTGKTTVARIMASSINRGQGNPIEIDGASNNGVDNVRSIIEDCRYKSLDSEYKIYILDECHMLSTGAWNAMLKVLEEPSENVVFILCTTDPQKIPNTILSRVQRMDFTRIPAAQIVKRLKTILVMEGEEIDSVANSSTDVISYEDAALEYIAKLADGGMRDAIMMMDKVLGYAGRVNMEDVQVALSTPDYSLFLDLIRCILKSQPGRMIDIIDRFHMSGKDLKLTMRNFCDFVLDMCKYIVVKSIDITLIPDSYTEDVKRLALEADYNFFLWVLDEMCKLNNSIKWETNPKPVIQSCLLILCKEDT